MNRNLNKFYNLLYQLQQVNQGLFGVRNWREITLGRMNSKPPAFKKIPKGIYFYFDTHELRCDGSTLRVIRIGTHGVKKGEGKSTLWGRLRHHRGTTGGQWPGGGDHRGSVFRDLVGGALMNRNGQVSCPAWSCRHVSEPERRQEHTLELAVSRYIRELPFVVLYVNPTHKGDEVRKRVEANAIALLSNTRRSRRNTEHLDPPSPHWLGRFSTPEVRQSGLWQSDHTDEECQPDFLEEFESLVLQMNSLT